MKLCWLCLKLTAGNRKRILMSNDFSRTSETGQNLSYYPISLVRVKTKVLIFQMMVSLLYVQAILLMPQLSQGESISSTGVNIQNPVLIQIMRIPNNKEEMMKERKLLSTWRRRQLVMKQSQDKIIYQKLYEAIG